jgi:predicted ATPase/DNA-binding CsgD family transcriptional regulator
VAQAAVGTVPGEGVHGFGRPLTSFVGRAVAVDEVAGLLGEFRLVTVTGPGGVGKTRLAGEVARRVVGGFADGVWLVELAGVRDPDLVSATVAAGLGIPQAPGVSVVESVTGVLARQQMLVVLDNCEHLAGAVAELCRALLLAADDVRILATSREPVGAAGEARYRLQPLTMPGPDDLVGGKSEAVTLFVDRARHVDPHFALTGPTRPTVARLVQQLDGMPLAIELAAARVESLGVDQLLDRLGDWFVLFGGADRTASARHRSLAAAVDWSYQLLGEDERRLFRWLAIFPGPFTLEGAETVAGHAAGPTVLRLVDCSLLSPPRADPDGRARYVMLEMLRAYGADRLAEAQEQAAAAAALARYAILVAERAAADMESSTGELASARWLDAEDATVHKGLTWAQQHDPATALRLAIALAAWWQLRGRTVAGYALLHVAASQAPPDTHLQCAAQLWLGHLAYSTHDNAAALGHYATVLGSPTTEDTPRVAVEALIGKSSALRNLDRVPEAAEDARRALGLARELGYPTGEALALTELGLAAHYGGDHETLLRRAREACRIDPALISGTAVRRRDYVLMIALDQADQVAAAQQSCVDGLARARDASDMQSQAAFLDAIVHQDLQAGRLSAAGEHLREAIEIALQTGDQLRLIDCLEECGTLCAAGHRWAEAVTMWSAASAFLTGSGTYGIPTGVQRVTSIRVFRPGGREELVNDALAALGPDRIQAATKRGTAMTMKTAAEFAIMLTSSDPQQPQSPPGGPQLSARERELVMLVAKGRTDAEIAGQLHISVRTVSSHLDRIRDKTGCRRRADLTRLALQAALV